MKKILIVILCAIMIGGGAAFYLFNKIVVKAEVDEKTLVNAFQIGAFSNYDNAERIAVRNNGIVVADEDIYRVYVAVLSDQEAIKKMKKYYEEIGLNYYLKEIAVNSSYIDNIKNEEELIKRSSSDTYVTINREMLQKYEELL
ncbi:MAG: SPOR domain-containing protein [Bacilli bacterium]|nr:SPOR domain-containing protein [Bacilli bacterium]